MKSRVEFRSARMPSESNPVLAAIFKMPEVVPLG
jgi:hypothetical protein